MEDGTSVAAARDQKAKEGADAKAKREADAKAEEKRLKDMKKMTKSKTDHDLLDDVVDGESVAEARERKAKEGADAKAKREADAKAEEKRLKDMKKNTAARTDNDLLDDVMEDGTSVAAARDQKAKEGADAKAKREADAKAEEKRLKDMKKNTEAKTDDGDGKQF